MERIKKIVLISILALLTAGLAIYIQMKRSTTIQIPALTLKRPILTIFVHGTFHLPIMPKMGIKFVHNCIDTFIFAQKGLHKVNSLEEHYTHAWTKKFHNYHMIKTISEANPERFPFDSFYIFCWSGELSPEKRFHAAQKLHACLVPLVAEYTEMYGIEPYIQLITHSHGGNVALNLAKVNDTSSTQVSIDELILLACPVQYETSHLIHHDSFKKIYSLHSHWDIIQVIDAQGWVPFKERVRNLFKSKADNAIDTPEVAEESSKDPCFFSERHFESNPKLVQANINYGMRGMFHVEFISETFMQHLPALLDSIDTQKEHYLPSENIDLCMDLNPMIKQSRRLRLAAKKEVKKNLDLAQQTKTITATPIV